MIWTSQGFLSGKKLVYVGNTRFGTLEIHVLTRIYHQDSSIRPDDNITRSPLSHSLFKFEKPLGEHKLEASSIFNTCLHAKYIDLKN
jgi:hypothetical protein